MLLEAGCFLQTLIGVCIAFSRGHLFESVNKTYEFLYAQLCGAGSQIGSPFRSPLKVTWKVKVMWVPRESIQSILCQTELLFARLVVAILCSY